MVSGCAKSTLDENYELDSTQESYGYHNYVEIKYRDDVVDIADTRFQALDTSRSSFIRGAWYDEDNEYMIINLDGTYYHYCGMPSNTWSSFKVADSFGSHYNRFIKGDYDCRMNSVPIY